MKQRTRLIKYFCLLVVIGQTIENAQSQEKKPNVVFIICDDLNDYEGVFGGHPQAITPNMDRLAQSGVQFMNAQSNAPVCQPSRNSIFTGVYPHDSGDFGWTPMQKQKVLKHNKTIIQLFKENGYHTLGSGKITHGKPTKDWIEWGMNPVHNYGPFYNDGTKNTTNPSVPEPFKNIGPIDGSYGRLSDAGESLGEHKQPGWVLGWDMKPMKYINDDNRDLLPDERHAKWAIESFSRLAKDTSKKPFFMGIGFVRPHTPLHAPDKYFDMYPMDKLKLNEWIPKDTEDTFWANNFSQKLKGPKYYKMLLESYGGNKEVALKHFLQAYLACVTFVDDQIGKVMDALNESPLKDNTIVVLTSDHGWQMGEKNYLFKNSPWEQSTRIPLIIKTPGTKANIQINHPVSLVDLFPTLVDYCSLSGNPKKNKKGANLGGHSLRPFLESTENWKGPNGALSIVGNYGNKYPKEKQNYSYRSEHFRYILYSNGEEELYDHRKDSQEWINLAYDKKFKKIKKELKKEVIKIIN